MYSRVERLLQLSNADVAKRKRAVVVSLERDVPLLCAAVIRPVLELAGLHLGFPVRTPQLVFEGLGPIEPVLDVRALREDARLIPLTDPLWFGARRRRIERVGGSRTRQRRLVIVGLLVVEQLVFGAAPVDMLVFLGAAIEDAGVSAFADLPFERKLEVAEIVLRHEVGDACVLEERAVDDLPSIRYLVGLVPAPGLERGAVEQGLPVAGVLRGCLRACAREQSRARRGGRNHTDPLFPVPHQSSPFRTAGSNTRMRRNTISTNHAHNAIVTNAADAGRRSVLRSAAVFFNVAAVGRHWPPVASASDFKSRSSGGLNRYSAAASGTTTRDVTPPILPVSSPGCDRARTARRSAASATMLPWYRPGATCCSGTLRV